MKNNLLVLAYVSIMFSLSFGAYTMHASMNAEYVPATWASQTISVNNRAVVDAARKWEAPIFIGYDETAADVIVEFVELTGVEGDAQTFVKDDIIVGCLIRIDPDYYSETLMMHEFGHCLGLHHENPDALMGKYAGADDITSSDRKALARLYPIG